MQTYWIESDWIGFELQETDNVKRMEQSAQIRSTRNKIVSKLANIVFVGKMWERSGADIENSNNKRKTKKGHLNNKKMENWEVKNSTYQKW